MGRVFGFLRLGVETWRVGVEPLAASHDDFDLRQGDDVMRKLAILILLAALALPAFAEKRDAVERVTVAQLEQALAASHGSPDAQVAQQLSRLELIERLSAARLARLQESLPGPQAQHALAVLSDTAAFLDLPAADTPSTPPPSHAQQTALMALTREYVVKTLTKLPNFFASRETTRFEGSPVQSTVSSGIVAKYGLLHQVGSSSVTVLYRDHQESVDQEKNRKASPRDKELRTMGEFGPILATVLNDAAKGTVIWSHWEQGGPGLLAVFHYAVPEQASHYRVASVGAMRETQRDPAYHGEIAIDPADGSILRLTVVAELKPDNPMTNAGLLVDYGPVEFGGVTYICPVRSLALSLVRVVLQQVDDRDLRLQQTSFGPPQAYLNAVLFTQYHLFRADTRILAGDSQEPAATPPANAPK
jgi:hypothetical protein